MGRNGTGLGWESANRKPLWETGYNVAAPMYTYIRTLAWCAALLMNFLFALLPTLPCCWHRHGRP